MNIIPATPDTDWREARTIERLAEVRARTAKMAQVAETDNGRAIEILAAYSAGTISPAIALRDLQQHHIDLCKMVERRENARYLAGAR